MHAVQGLISPPANAHLYSVLSDNGGFRHDDLTKSPAEMYTVPYVGSEAAIDYAELNPNFIVRVGYGSGSSTSSAFSSDGGSTWTAGATDIPGISGNGGLVAAAADGSRVLWAPPSAAVSYSTDNGTTWLASANVPQNSFAASDRVNPLRFYAYGHGQFWTSSDGGATFNASAATGLPKAGDPVVVKAVPGHEGDVWVAGGSAGNAYGIWHSTDGGNTFTQLPHITTADKVGFGKAAPGRQYVAVYTNATVQGVYGFYRSDDGGKHWIRINDNAHQYASITTITGDPRIFGRVYMGTNGFGIVYGDVAF